MFDMSKIIRLFLFIVFLSLLISPVIAESQSSDENVNIYFFWAEGCPHCAHEKPFLGSLEQKYSNVEVHSFEVTKSRENVELLQRVGEELNADVSGVPFTVVGKQYFSGWYDEKTTGAAIEEAVQCVIKNSCPDIVGSLITPVTPNPIPEKEKTIPEKISLPILGEIETKNLSLPLFAVVMGALDGFNPCAMWVLLFLITMLLGMKNKKRMWILGSVFIITSGAVYFLFMAAWLNLILFLGFIFWIRIIIALVALGGGVYNLREYFINKDSGCKVVGGEKRQKVFEKLKRISQEQKFWLALGGIMVLAAGVNLVELICSAGLPVIFTQVLALSNLATWQYYSYMLIYIFVFMLDDLFVFFTAMITLQLTGITTKYTRISHLIGGIIMVVIGILLIFKPEWLMFG
jgi:thiol-disulfide isomerase/thioredoxin